jgi:hypothetical protein
MRKQNVSLLFFWLLIFGYSGYCQTGILKISLDMDGDELYIDNQLKKKDLLKNNPIVIDLPIGKHIVKLIKEGYVDEINSVTIKVDEVTKLNIHFRKVTDILLKEEESGTQIQAYGKLTIFSNPSGANILIEGKLWKNAKTPDTFEKLPTGTYNVSVELNGIMAEQLVKIEKDKTTKVNFEVKEKKGKLKVVGFPANASIYLNNNYFKKPPFTEDLRIGSYNISVRANNFLDEDYKFNIEENKYTIVNYDLKKPIPVFHQATIYDINRTKKEKLDFNEFKRMEYETVKVNRRKTFYFISGGLVLTSIMVSVLGDSNAGGMMFGVSLLCFPISSMIPNTTKEVPIPENIEYNRRKRNEIVQFNRDVDNYNQKTQKLLNEENEKRKNDVKQETDDYNKGRNTTIIIK